MADYPKLIFWGIEINLILWLAAFGSVAAGKEWSLPASLCVVGVIGSAILQHWAYYHIYKPQRGSQ